LAGAGSRRERKLQVLEGEDDSTGLRAKHSLTHTALAVRAFGSALILIRTLRKPKAK